ncbi:hypothetical protein FGB62_87g068 [Gracilaria domingensis]|nr:hypothetical protein FGB62_87g068 [Gracilaria domingensis]
MDLDAFSYSTTLVLFFGYVLTNCVAKEHKCSPSISALVAPSPAVARASIVGKTYSDLIDLGFVENGFSDYCSRLLMTEKESAAVVFPDSISCVKHFCKDDPIRHVQEDPGNKNGLVNREMLWHLCDGSCAVRLSNGKAIVRKTGSGIHWELRQGDFLFREKMSTGRMKPLLMLPFALVAALTFRFHKRLVSPALICVAVVVLWFYMKVDKGTSYSLVVQEYPSEDAISIGNFVLHNFSYSVIRRGDGRCAIYTCNRFKGVQNFRFRTHCDVLNFRVPHVTRRGRPVKLNWLKVLTGVWLLEHKEYDHIVYADRDLILDRDPSCAFGHQNVVFSDLGGAKPDSAMFIFRNGNGINHLSVLHSWLKKETGETTRRDGGEEQAALFNLPTNLTHVAAQRLYMFQCGRNSINRAECLHRRRYLSVDVNIVLTKLLLETLRPTVFKFTPYRLLVPTLIFREMKHSVLRELIPLVLPILEIIIYQRWVVEAPVTELRCPQMSTKAISYGSFDNPYTQTFSSLSAVGVVSRTPKGWVCTDLSQGWGLGIILVYPP